jgi:demethylmenaquinone methyltransferase/2-methoxy-6-polyprenyl-1,4-benzoquinol methylase
VPESRKASRVGQVFDSVASRYDMMNDLMSAGLHRVWKAFTVAQAAVKPGMRVLDVAGGTGDLSRQFARRVGPTGEVWLTDINGSMLSIGRDRLLDEGRLSRWCAAMPSLPFPVFRFVVAFGLRNMPKDRALAEMTRVLAWRASAGLEFSRSGNRWAAV